MKQASIEWLFEQIPLEWTTKRSAFAGLFCLIGNLLETFTGFLII